MYLASDGIHWQDAERLARAEHARYFMHDSWEDTIVKHLHRDDGFDGAEPGGCGSTSVREILVGPLEFQDKHIKRADQMRVASILRKLGYESSQKWLDGRNKNVWIRTSS